MADVSQLVSTRHVCHRLQLSPAAVRRLTDSGRLFAVLPNRQRFYDRALWSSSQRTARRGKRGKEPLMSRNDRALNTCRGLQFRLGDARR